MGPIEIKKLRTSKQKELCAQWMANSEPWKTLKRSYQDSLAVFYNRTKNYFMMYAEKKPIGFLILNTHGVLSGYIQTIFIIPEFQGKGIGTQVMKFAEEELFREFSNVFLCVSSFNKKAEQLYRELGYAKVGVLEDFFVKGYDEIIFRKTREPISSYGKK